MQKVGLITYMRLPKYWRSQKLKGYAFIEFEVSEPSFIIFHIDES